MSQNGEWLNEAFSLHLCLFWITSKTNGVESSNTTMTFKKLIATLLNMRNRFSIFVPLILECFQNRPHPCSDSFRVRWHLPTNVEKEKKIQYYCQCVCNLFPYFVMYFSCQFFKLINFPAQQHLIIGSCDCYSSQFCDLNWTWLL